MWACVFNMKLDLESFYKIALQCGCFFHEEMLPMVIIVFNRSCNCHK